VLVSDFSSDELLSNFNLKNMILTYLKDCALKEWCKFAGFQDFSLQTTRFL
jgi:hypothetical protein